MTYPPQGPPPNPGQPDFGQPYGNSGQFANPEHYWANQPDLTQPPAKKRGGCFKWGAIVFGVLLVIFVIAGLAGGDDGETATDAPTTTQATPAATEPQGEDLSPGAEPETFEPEPPAPEPEVPDVPREFENAVRSAEQYLNYTAFSKQGLVDQLQFENFSPEAAQYAADTVNADWNEQAVKSAEQYLNYTSFSRQGLVDQLIFEGFTPEQAEYGASQVY